jgi:tetratricopeptide (TPR) repeat protein
VADNPRIEQLERRVKEDPTSIAFAALAEEYRRAGRYREAVETCRAGLARHPAYLSARVTLGRALIELDRLDEAQAELEAVLKAAPENLAAIRGLAEIHHRRGELHEALEFYRTALDLARHDTGLHDTVEQIAREVEPVRRPLPFTSRSSEQRQIVPAGAGPHQAASAIASARAAEPPTVAARQIAALERFLAAIVRARGEAV